MNKKLRARIRVLEPFERCAYSGYEGPCEHEIDVFSDGTVAMQGAGVSNELIPHIMELLEHLDVD